ncbi:hypothetical protein KX75_20220 [Salmonella enterica subsp. enterica]|nr:hypothetical protein [Salmonella enterica subsp. enterica serovar Mikawasima]
MIRRFDSESLPDAGFILPTNERTKILNALKIPVQFISQDQLNYSSLKYPVFDEQVQHIKTDNFTK